VSGECKPGIRPLGLLPGYAAVKHGYVFSAKEWPYSSFHRYVQNKVLQENWGYDGVQGDLGE